MLTIDSAGRRIKPNWLYKITSRARGTHQQAVSVRLENGDYVLAWVHNASHGVSISQLDDTKTNNGVRIVVPVCDLSDFLKQLDTKLHEVAK